MLNTRMGSPDFQGWEGLVGGCCWSSDITKTAQEQCSKTCFEIYTNLSNIFLTLQVVVTAKNVCAVWNDDVFVPKEKSVESTQIICLLKCGGRWASRQKSLFTNQPVYCARYTPSSVKLLKCSLATVERKFEREWPSPPWKGMTAMTAADTAVLLLHRTW